MIVFDFKSIHLDIPIIQGGMGIGVSLGNLAGAVMKEGGLGVISAAQPGYRKESFRINPIESNIKALKEEISKARTLAQGKGALGINLMVAAEHYDLYAQAINEMDVDVIISGAGLPLELPRFITNPNIALAPIVSSARAAVIICKRWLSRHNRLPDFIVIEGPLAGGHLGFDLNQLNAHTAQKLEDILAETLFALKEYEPQIPLVVAGGIYTGEDIAKFIKLGASAVQMATRFIGTYECDADPQFKQVFIDGKEDDIDFVISPSGYPGRAFINSFVQRMRKGRIVPTQCVNCLIPCNPSTTPYCITDALIAAVKGDIDEGLVFTGTNGYKLSKLISVKELISNLMFEMEAAL